jgi:hypothetical protein
LLFFSGIRLAGIIPEDFAFLGVMRIALKAVFLETEEGVEKAA